MARLFSIDPDDTGAVWRRMAAVGLVALLIAGLIVLGTATQTYMDLSVRRGEDVVFWRVVRWPAIWWLGWVLLAPFVFEGAWRIHLTRQRWIGPLLLLLAGCALFFVLDVAYQVAWMYTEPFGMIHPDFADAVEHHTITSLYLNIFIYWCIVGCAHALRAYQQAQQRALRAAQLESELANARLDALKMQLHPHFLFNTLHGISTLMYRDVATADRMVNRLSQLLRHTLDRSDDHEIALGEEIGFLEEYLAIEQLRFGDQLHVHFDIEEGLDEVMVPSFVFQPLVENAIKHGIAPNGNAGTIRVGARQEGDRLLLYVSDDGPGLHPGEEAMSVGVGLSNLHERLSGLYGKAYDLDLRDADPQGLLVHLTLPLRRSPRVSGVRHGKARVVPERLG